MGMMTWTGCQAMEAASPTFKTVFFSSSHQRAISGVASLVTGWTWETTHQSRTSLLDKMMCGTAAPWDLGQAMGGQGMVFTMTRFCVIGVSEGCFAPVL